MKKHLYCACYCPCSLFFTAPAGRSLKLDSQGGQFNLSVRLGTQTAEDVEIGLNFVKDGCVELSWG